VRRPFGRRLFLQLEKQNGAERRRFLQRREAPRTCKRGEAARTY
jgi:hypothetical protein